MTAEFDFDASALNKRAAELLSADLGRMNRQTDRMFAWLLMAQWLAGIGVAWIISPRTWMGSESEPHLHLYGALFLGGLITIPAAMMGLFRSGESMTRQVIAVSQMLWSALLIHLSGGRIETHFHVFGSLAFLAIYRDYRVLITASLVVAVDHFLRGVLWPQSVFGILSPAPWRWAEHAGWVLFENIFLISGCIRGNRELAGIAQRQAALEMIKGRFEWAVEERTSALAETNAQLNAEMQERVRMESTLAEAKEAAEAANRAKSQFLANMSHEIRTPMNGVMGMNRLLLDTPLDTEQRLFAETIETSCEALLTVVNDVLDLAKIESGHMILNEERFSLAECVKQSLNLFIGTAAEKNIELASFVSPELPDALLGDVTRLRQVLVNLIGNGLKFTDAGKVEIEVRPGATGPDANGRIELCFLIRDTGIGIPKAGREYLFKVFSQVDTSMSRRHGGSGLGLVISQQLVRLMGGSIWFESVEAEGSTFHFTMRARIAEERGPTPYSKTSDASPKNPRKHLSPERLRILLVEDNKVNQMVGSRFIEKLGYRCELAENGRKAIEVLERQHFQLVLMDVQMPELNGIEATRAIRGRALGDPRMRIVALTAHAAESDREDCLAAGMDDYLAKPLTLASLLEQIERTAEVLADAAS